MLNPNVPTKYLSMPKMSKFCFCTPYVQLGRELGGISNKHVPGTPYNILLAPKIV